LSPIDFYPMPGIFTYFLPLLPMAYSSGKRQHGYFRVRYSLASKYLCADRWVYCNSPTEPCFESSLSSLYKLS